MRMSDSDRVAIWGFGREGRATLAHLKARYPALTPTILNDTPVEADGVPVVTGAGVGEALAGGAFDVVVKSPGISLYRPEIAAAKAAGVRFTSATNLWFADHPGARVIAVTGTKGKSSTARLLQYLLQNAGYGVRLYGNVGYPVLGQPAGADVTVLEMSSYQIADLAYAPDVAVLTNLYPEHAPWHGGVETYYRDKLRLLDIDPAKTKKAANFACERLRTRLGGRDDIVWFNGETGFAAGESGLSFAGRAVTVRNFPLKGAHNFANLAAACAAADLFGAGVRECADLTGFVQLPHRLEEFSAGGILCVNDSLSTVPEACMAALKTYAGRPCVLILGGTDRGQDYAGLAAFLPATAVKTVLLLPATGARIGAALTAVRPTFEVLAVPDLAAAVAEGFRRLTPGDVFLMSPAAPSFGQFKNYEDRGEAFKTLCRAAVADGG